MTVELTTDDYAAVKGPVPVSSWNDSDAAWLADRRGGLGGSDVLAALGFSKYTSAWQVWREKTGEVEPDTESPSEAAELGTALEPWLLDQAPALIGEPVYRTLHRTYAHPDHWWRRCSPDGILADGRLVEAKTAGLASGFGTPPGWSDNSVPLGYEFQVRWSMHVMDAPAVEVIALVAGLGLIRRTVYRDTRIELKMVAQLRDWWERHVIGGEEPAMGAGDADVLAELYPTVERDSVDLDDTDALKHWEIYLAAREREKDAKAEKEAAGAELKHLLGGAQKGLVEGNVIATWNTKKSSVSYKRLLDDLAPDLWNAGIPMPDPEDYRGAPGRSLNVKDL